jgi:hypothetical protein
MQRVKTTGLFYLSDPPIRRDGVADASIRWLSHLA